MRKVLILLLFILAFCLLPKAVEAGIIYRPVFHTGLIGYWNFQEGAGNYAYDKSGYGNHGTWSNTGSHWADGQIGAGGSFDGGTNYVNCGDPSEFDFGSNDFTILAWAYRNSGWAAWDDIVVGKWNTGGSPGTNEFNLIHGGGNDTYPRFAIESGNETYVATSSETTFDDTWYHVTGMRTGNYIKIFVNGVEKASVDVTGLSINNIAGRTLKFGKIDGGTYGLDGYMDEVRIYNRALSADEVQRLYKLSQPKILAPTMTGLVGYWSFEEGMGTNVGDFSGNGNNGAWAGTGSHWTTGRFGNGGTFNGSDDYVTIPYSVALNPANVTVCMWMKQTGLGDATEWQVILHNQAWDARGYLYLIYPESGTTQIYWRVLGDPNYDIIYEIDTTVWNHYCGNYDGEYSNLYVNGQFVDNKLANYNPNDQNIIFGYDPSANNAYFEGIIDEVRIYDRALDASEIEAIYKSGLAKINSSQNNQLTNGLVGLWSFNGPDMDGNTAYDRSGQGNHGTLTGVPTRAIGKVGQALSFNGSSDYVEVGNFAVTDDLTVMAWVKPSALGDYDRIVDKGWDEDFYFGLSSNGQNLAFSVNGSIAADILIGDIALSIGTWYHIAAVYNGSTIQIYRNGIDDGSKIWTTDPDATDNTVRIGTGAGSNPFGEPYSGIIDEVRIYNRALSAEEVRRLYNMGR